MSDAPSRPIPPSLAADPVAQRFDALHDVNRRLQGMHGDAEIAQEVLAVLEEHLGYENGAVLLIVPETGALSPLALSDQGKGRGFVELDRAFIASLAPAVGRGITGWVAANGASVRSGDVTRDARYLTAREEIRSELCVPIRIGDRVIGVVNVESVRADAYDADDQRFLEIVATQIGLAIQLDRIRREAERVTAQIDAIVAERTRTIAAENDTLQRLAAIDPQTGIGNRRGFDAALALELRRAWRTGMPISLLLMDVDAFKAYNDRYGHVAGDACLLRVAQALAATVSRAGDYVARYGGDEFAAILPNTDAADARKVAERVRQGLAAERIAHSGSPAAPTVTLSAGIASVPPGSDAVSQAAIVNCADRALYEAKAKGRNAIVQMTL